MSKRPVAVGECYSTGSEQYRRVVGIDGDQVTYESWGGRVGYRGGHLHRETVGMDGFWGAVDISIPCPANLPPMPDLGGVAPSEDAGTDG